MFLLFLSLLACESPELGSPEYGAWAEHPCHSCHEVIMPFFLEATSGTAGDAAWSEHTPADDVLTTQGDILYRDGAGLARLPAGAAGQVLVTGGAGANPSWGAASAGALVQADSDTHVGASVNEEAFGNPYTIAANTLAVGTVIQAAYIVPLDAMAGSKDTVNLRVRLGGLAGTLLLETGDVTPGSDVTLFDVTLYITAVGAGGTGVMTGTVRRGTYAGAPVQYGGAVTTFAAQPLAIDTTAPQDLVVTVEAEVGTEMTNNALVWQY